MGPGSFVIPADHHRPQLLSQHGPGSVDIPGPKHLLQWCERASVADFDVAGDVSFARPRFLGDLHHQLACLPDRCTSGSLAALGVLIDRAVDEVRQGAVSDREVFSIAAFIAEAEGAACLEAEATGGLLTVRPVLQSMSVRGSRAMLHAALANLLQNAFKFTLRRTRVTLHAMQSGENVHIDVHDHCGGLAHGAADKLFVPVVQRNSDKSGPGLGLAIARHSVDADFGTLGVRDMPGPGCIFTISLPLHVDM